MNAPLVLYLLLAIIGVTGAIGDVFIYRWAGNGKFLMLASGAASWILCLYLFGLYCRASPRPLSIAFTLTAVVHIAIVVGWDVVAHGTRLTRLEWLGVALATIGVLVIETSRGIKTLEEN